MITLTERARAVLHPGEVLLFDWHPVGVCCSNAGEISIRAVPRSRLGGSARRFRPAECDPPDAALVHQGAWPHLAGRDVSVDVRLLLGFRRFTTDLPADFGLRASLGRLPGHVHQEAAHDHVPGRNSG